MNDVNNQEQASLYDRLGGYDAIYQFAAAALKKGMLHPKIGHLWANTSESSFMREHINFVDFLAVHWGGNAQYRGRDMVTTHRGMGLTDMHWEAMFETLEECYNEFDVPAELRKEVNDFFEKFKPVVIGSPSFRDVVMQNPDMDVTKGMKSVGVVWPQSNNK